MINYDKLMPKGAAGTLLAMNGKVMRKQVRWGGNSSRYFDEDGNRWKPIEMKDLKLPEYIEGIAKGTIIRFDGKLLKQVKDD
jgi:hypothetical protein